LDARQLKPLLAEDALKLYDEREAELGEELMRALERYLLLQIIDQRWREHLYDMDYLREGIHLRGFAQIDPLVAYKNEAFTLFQDLMNSIWSDFARMIYNVEVEVDQTTATVRCRASTTGDGTAALNDAGVHARGISQRVWASAMDPSTLRDGCARGAPGGTVVEAAPCRRARAAGPHDPCWCGSGRKFKKCHGA
jgi:preprotein translocase subunit SecA